MRLAHSRCSRLHQLSNVWPRTITRRTKLSSLVSSAGSARADDPTHARQLAQEIFRSLGFTNDGGASQWTDMAPRAWTLMSQNYDSLRAAGQLVVRNDEDVDACGRDAAREAAVADEGLRHRQLDASPLRAREVDFRVLHALSITTGHSGTHRAPGLSS